MRLGGYVVAVTGGGAGSIGGAIAWDLARQGAQVLSMTRTSAPQGERLSSLQVDVGDEQQVQTAFAQIEERYGRLDAMVVSAGVQLHGADARIEDVSLETWDRTISTNLTGAFLSIKYAMPMLSASGRGSVVLIGSPTGMTMSGAGYTAYSASKAGMMGLSRVIAADYAAANVRSNVIVPGTIETPLVADLLEHQATHAALVAATPLGRLGRPEDLVGLASWLVSEESRFATGAVFAVDGGLTAR